MDEHEHDWRVDPFHVYTTNPPQRREICAECGVERRVTIDTSTYTNDPWTWPKSPRR